LKRSSIKSPKKINQIIGNTSYPLLLLKAESQHCRERWEQRAFKVAEKNKEGFLQRKKYVTYQRKNDPFYEQLIMKPPSLNSRDCMTAASTRGGVRKVRTKREESGGLGNGGALS
jgi:hypothetical protein